MSSERNPSGRPDARSLFDADADHPALVRARTREDDLEGSWSVAMAPMWVDWDRSQLEGREDDHYLLRNVNTGGNPMAGTTVLAPLRVPRWGVEEVQYVVVPWRMLGTDTPGAHVQLRIRFREEHRPRPVDRQGHELAVGEGIRDLVFSWEAWRGAGSAFDPQKALEDHRYRMTTRCFEAAQRFLEDGLQKRLWVCYPLALPAVENAGDELLATCLSLGDSLTRHAVAPPSDGPDAAPVTQEGAPGYQLLVRSCVTMALAAIDLTVARLRARHDLGPHDPIRVVPGRIPSWITELATADTLHLAAQLPRALWWLLRHQEVIPLQSYRLLEERGLLRTDDDGDPISHRYDLGEGDTPYGRLRAHMIE